MPILVCPTCRQEITYRGLDQVPYRPFCCRRCQRIDLHKWLSEEYVISEELSPAGPPGEEWRPPPDAPSDEPS